MLTLLGRIALGYAALTALLALVCRMMPSVLAVGFVRAFRIVVPTVGSALAGVVLVLAASDDATAGYSVLLGVVGCALFVGVLCLSAITRPRKE
jgi:hypothetical protein